MTSHSLPEDSPSEQGSGDTEYHVDLDQDKDLAEGVEGHRYSSW